MTGQKFGELTVISRANNLMDRVAWNCMCDCGNPNAVIVRSSDLTTGHTKTCGHAANRNSTKIIRNKDDQIYGRISRIYHNMKQRCLNPNSNQYEDYGGRGIFICKEWLGDEGLEKFYKWSIENGYHENLTLDRINVNKGYTPKNCRWADKETQSNNRRNNRYITMMGQKKTIRQWEKHLGLPTGTLYRNIENGLLNERLLKNINHITYDGRSLKMDIQIHKQKQ